MNEPTDVVIGIGTRPEAIKVAPVYRQLLGQSGIRPHLLLTGQHSSLVEQVLDFYGIDAAADLETMTDRQSLPELGARILTGTAEYLREAEPDYVLVQGDTLSTFMVAWAAHLQGIPVGHIEAGLRSYDLTQPFPEESCRRLTDAISDLCFAPTEGARDNLLRAGVELSRIIVTGQTGVDAVLHAAAAGNSRDDLPPGSYVTVTVHRRENWPALEAVGQVLADVAATHPDHTFVFPVHLNPVVREAVGPALAGIPNVRLVEPLSHGAMAALLSRSDLIITDSGGLQEEGLTLGVPVVVLRDVTERPEAVVAGNSVLCGTDPDMIRHAVTDLLGRSVGRRKGSANPFGDGQAAHRVAEGVAWRLGRGPRPADWIVRPPLRVLVDR